ncbi:hypothetical protein J2T55_000140 [Methylohalomonas lacus]|uniref:Uncharacterized protein n=1 Tax=Methylohalomonas lacus TaxID=398773 RepID=A0AAE3HJ61_9GAMM|nr:hypothetical protein [Methylohalomonas lacus]MCS3902148.1 hypothetical protein [Methylohalomonas lacus]
MPILATDVLAGVFGKFFLAGMGNIALFSGLIARIMVMQSQLMYETLLSHQTDL